MQLNWKVGGLLLGLVFFAAVLLVKPIGVSTQFVILDGIVADAVSGAKVKSTAPLTESAPPPKSISSPLNVVDCETVTESFKVIPLAAIEAVLIVVEPAALVVKLLRGSVPPTTPLNVVAPAPVVLTVNARAGDAPG